MKLQFQAAGRRCSSNLCPILHSSDALISASQVASSIPRLWLLTSSQDSPQLQVHSCEYVCSTCVDALNRLWTKILPVVNAAICAQVHVQIVFCSTCSMMVQLCGVPLLCSQLLSPYAGHDRRMLHDSMYVHSAHVSPGRHFSSGPRQLRFSGAPVPGFRVPSPLASWTTKLTDVEVRFLHSTASRWTRWRSLFVALRSAS